MGEGPGEGSSVFHAVDSSVILSGSRASAIALNPYNPFLGIWTTLTRQARWYEGALHPEETLTREQALRFYTINNAYLLFLSRSAILGEQRAIVAVQSR
jgi:predicted amidohydrolase YtcJ